jgi:hypothetical protein
MESAKRSDDRPRDAGRLSQHDLDVSRGGILRKIGQLAYAAPALALLAEPKPSIPMVRGRETATGTRTTSTPDRPARPKSTSNGRLCPRMPGGSAC